MSHRSPRGGDRLAGLLAEFLSSAPSQRQQALPVTVRGLHQVILQECTVRGRAPARAELAPIATSLGLDVGQALAHLAASDLLVLDSGGEIAAAYPYSTTPTSHRVEITGGPTVFAMCALAALGIPAITGRNVTITSADPATGAPAHIDVRDGYAYAHPADTAVSLAADLDEQAARSCCPLINFHSSPQAAERYQESTGQPGIVLSLPEATDTGARLFGPLLRAPTPDLSPAKEASRCSNNSSQTWRSPRSPGIWPPA